MRTLGRSVARSLVPRDAAGAARPADQGADPERRPGAGRRAAVDARPGDRARGVAQHRGQRLRPPDERGVPRADLRAPGCSSARSSPCSRHSTWPLRPAGSARPPTVPVATPAVRLPLGAPRAVPPEPARRLAVPAADLEPDAGAGAPRSEGRELLHYQAQCVAGLPALRAERRRLPRATTAASAATGARW